MLPVTLLLHPMSLLLTALYAPPLFPNPHPPGHEEEEGKQSACKIIIIIIIIGLYFIE